MQDRFQAIVLAMVPLSYSAIYSFVQADIRYSYPLLWLHVLLAMEMFVRQLRPDDQRQTSRSSTAPG